MATPSFPLQLPKRTDHGYLLMNFCNAECIYRKHKQGDISLLQHRSRFPEMPDPWRPAHSIKVTPRKPDIRSSVIHYFPILTRVGLSRFISIVTSGDLLPTASITPLPPEREWASLQWKQTERLRAPLLVPITREGFREHGTVSNHHRGQHAPS